MIAIIDNFKYDTETAQLLYESEKLYRISEKKYSLTTVYRNRKLAFFKLVIDMEGEKEEAVVADYHIVPMSKKEVQDFLMQEEQYEKYEEIFGAFEEPVGEDYISEEEQYQIELAAQTSALLEQLDPEEFMPAPPDDVPPKAIRRATEFSLFQSMQLLWHCGTNDYLKVKKSIESGADCRYRKSLCLVKAIVNRNLQVIRLLLESGANPCDDNAKAITLAFCTGNTGIIRCLCDGRTLDEPLLLYGIEKCSKLQDVESVRYLSSLLKGIDNKNERNQERMFS